MKNLETWKIILKPHQIAVLFLLALVSGAALYLAGDSGGVLEEEEGLRARIEVRKTGEGGEPTAYEEERNGVVKCDLFSGRWVLDTASYPLYEEGRCSFMLYQYAQDEYACLKNGRTDLKYQKWRWQPHRCDLPRFNGTALLEKIRGKRLVYVGDSLNRNQWTSMLCLIESSLPKSSYKSMTFNGNLAFFRASEYNATIEFYWSPLLVESNCDSPSNHSTRDRIIRITDIEKHARHWNDADILIFDSFMWWLEPTMTLLWGSFGSSDAFHKRVEMKQRRYEMALNTWSDWLEININRTKTKLFFMSLSPFHQHGERWDIIQNCYNQTDPIMKEGYRGIETDREMMRVVESVIQKLETRGLKVEYLNITHLSEYRKDAHPSIYRKFSYDLSEEQLANPESYSDCVHWCLPGVPDVWNEILYSYIINS